MTYVKQQWATGSIVSPNGPLNGARLNYIETGIQNAHLAIDGHTAGTGDVHTQYILKTQKNAANGVAGLGAGARLAPAQMAQVAAAYTVTNSAARRLLDANNFTDEMVVDLVCTLILDLIAAGVLHA